MKHKY